MIDWSPPISARRRHRSHRSPTPKGPLRRRVALLSALALTAFLLPIRAVIARQLCFAEPTSYCLNDPFADYWEQQGGLPVFGYPIAPPTHELNRDTGQRYLTQWVERNRLEEHPEEHGPYRVLLGLLGKERLAQLGRDWAAEPRDAGPQAGCLWFEQTGHNVCNQEAALGFKTYWETHGLASPGGDRYTRSLQLFGLPLTAPHMETNTSGDTVLTQWFERARFEWHPTNPTAFKVLLGRLGNKIRQADQTTFPFTTTINPDLRGTLIIHAQAQIFTVRADGSTIAHVPWDPYSLVSPDRTKKAATCAGVPGICIISLKDGTSTRLNERESQPLDWSGDGRYLLYSADSGVSGAGPYPLRNYYLAAVDGSITTKALKNMEPLAAMDVSPDGGQLLYQKFGEPGALYVINSEGTQNRTITDGGILFDPQWSPDGKRIAYRYESSTVDSPEQALYLIGADGSKKTRLTRGDDRPETYLWSPDGRQIVFVSRVLPYAPGRESPRTLYRIRDDGQNKQPLIPTGSFPKNEQPEQIHLGGWSPDGHYLVAEIGCPLCYQQIIAVEHNGSRVLTLTRVKNWEDASMHFDSWLPE